jgi:hypothetical protein
VVAQIDISRTEIESWGVQVPHGEDGEEGAYFRLPSGHIFSLIRMEGNSVPGFALLCGDPGERGWEGILEEFIEESGIERSSVIWVPGDEGDR